VSAVKAIRYLLANNANLIAVVAATKIFSGAIPLNTALPAIVVKHISTTERLAIKNAGAKFCVSRVQVTVQAKTYATQKSILELVRIALASTHATVNGVEVDSIAPDGAGPDLWDADADIYEQSRDFLVRWIVAS
jgi:hypothetical protein